MLVLFKVTLLIVATVWFALEGQPIAGNAVRVAGFSVVTLAAVVLAAMIPWVGLWVARSQWETERNALGPAAAPAARFTAVSTRIFLEFAPALSVGGVCALAYHLTADNLLLVAVGCLELFLLSRFPTRRRVQRLFQAV
jgi:hypothetical protein